MAQRVITADDVLRLARNGPAECAVAADDLVTPLARDVARERGVQLVTAAPAPPKPGSAPQGRTAGAPRPRLRHVPSVSTMALEAFPFAIDRPDMDVRLRDVVTAEHGMPMAAGVMSLRQGSFPWTLDYDEVEYVLEGELHITTTEERAVGRPGDLIAVPRGSNITFGTPSWTRFLYVTYPADWAGGA